MPTLVAPRTDTASARATAAQVEISVLEAKAAGLRAAADDMGDMLQGDVLGVTYRRRAAELELEAAALAAHHLLDAGASAQVAA